MKFVRAIININGVVQGVGFRYYCLRQAGEFGLAGYCANLSDGSVEIEVEGDRGLVEEFIKTVKVGPTYASVTDLKINWYESPKGYKKFDIKYKD